MTDESAVLVVHFLNQIPDECTLGTPRVHPGYTSSRQRRFGPRIRQVSTMGAAWSYFVQRDDAFDKDAYVSSPGGFYALFKQSVAIMEDELGPSLATDSSTSDAIREEAHLVLQHWTREADVLYGSATSAFPLAIDVKNELEIDEVRHEGLSGSGSSVLKHKQLEPPSTREEAVMRGLCSNPLSSSESIYQATLQLQRCLGDGDEFLSVLGAHPRAFRLFMSQQKLAESDVDLAFRAAALARNYAQAGALVGSLAYSDTAFPVKLKRLEEMSKAMRRGVDESALSLSEVVSINKAELDTACSARARMSFNQVMTDEMISLLETQRKLEAVLQVAHFVGSSLIETIQKLVALYPNHTSTLLLAADCAEQYKVSPCQFWWILLRVLAQNGQWRVLLFLARARRPEIGYTPIVEVLLDADQDDLAHPLIECIEAHDEREEVITLLAKVHRPNA